MITERPRAGRTARRTLAALACLAAYAPAARASDESARASAHRPVATDFSQPVPSSRQLREPTARSERVAERHGGYGIAGAVLYRSVPVEAPHRFDIVGIAGEMHAMEFRARRDGHRWSEWDEVDNGDPVYTGGTDQVQIRSRGVPIEGRLHYVRIPREAQPEIPSQLDRTPLSRRTGKGKRRRPPAPKFVTRREWGANQKRGGCRPRTTPEAGRVRAAAVHHTVSLNTYTEAQAPSIVLGICRYHRDANGWNDIGYNALVDRFGNVYEGRAGGLKRAIVGAQAEGVNSQTTGVATIADHSKVSASSKEKRALIRYLAWKLSVARIPATGRVNLHSDGGSTSRRPKGGRIRVTRIFSHSDTNFTECAGEALRAKIPGIRRAVQRRIDRFAGPPPAPPPPTDPGGVAPR